MKRMILAVICMALITPFVFAENSDFSQPTDSFNEPSENFSSPTNVFDSPAESFHAPS